MSTFSQALAGNRGTQLRGGRNSYTAAQPTTRRAGSVPQPAEVDWSSMLEGYNASMDEMWASFMASMPQRPANAQYDPSNPNTNVAPAGYTPELPDEFTQSPSYWPGSYTYNRNTNTYEGSNYSDENFWEADENRQVWDDNAVQAEGGTGWVPATNPIRYYNGSYFMWNSETNSFDPLSSNRFSGVAYDMRHPRDRGNNYQYSVGGQDMSPPTSSFPSDSFGFI